MNGENIRARSMRDPNGASHLCWPTPSLPEQPPDRRSGHGRIVPAVYLVDSAGTAWPEWYRPWPSSRGSSSDRSAATGEPTTLMRRWRSQQRELVQPHRMSPVRNDTERWHRLREASYETKYAVIRWPRGGARAPVPLPHCPPADPAAGSRPCSGATRAIRRGR
jgi:hypothetical protein